MVSPTSSIWQNKGDLPLFKTMLLLCKFDFQIYKVFKKVISLLCLASWGHISQSEYFSSDGERKGESKNTVISDALPRTLSYPMPYYWNCQLQTSSCLSLSRSFIPQHYSLPDLPASFEYPCQSPHPYTYKTLELIISIHSINIYQNFSELPKLLFFRKDRGRMEHCTSL